MPRASAILGTVALDRRSTVPLQQQLYRALREAILDGRLASGVRLPSSRLLARELGAGRNTVVAVFEQLAAEGYVSARVGDGTRVAAVLPDRHFEVHEPAVPVRGAAGVGAVHAGARATSQRSWAGGPGVPAGARAPDDAAPSRAGLSRRGAVLVSTPRPGPFIEPVAFQTGRPDHGAFPLDLWARLVTRRTRRPPRGGLGYAHAAGLPALREAIVTHLGAFRGVAARPEQVIVVSGAQAGLDLACRLLTDAGDTAWIEDPGYLGARAALAAAGLRAVPVPVDDEGLDVRAGARRAPRARLVHVTPSHQFPLGVTMTLGRRLALIDWAAHRGAWVLEDDYDSEFRYRGRPLAAMRGIDQGGRVIHLGTFSKTMFAALRVGWLVVPSGLEAAFATAIRHTGHTVPTNLQAALADFLVEGHFAAHLRRMRVLYAARQARLVTALRRRLGDLVRVDPPPAGLQMPVWLPDGVGDGAVSRAAAEAGVIAAPLSLFRQGPAIAPGLLLGFAGVPDREIDRGVERLARVVEAAVRASRQGSRRATGPAPADPTRTARLRGRS